MNLRLSLGGGCKGPEISALYTLGFFYQKLNSVHSLELQLTDS